MTAAAQVLQLVRAHFRRDETAFLSAATILARAAKTFLDEIVTELEYRDIGQRRSTRRLTVPGRAVKQEAAAGRELPARQIAQVIVAKDRGGNTGSVLLKFTGEYTRFDNLAGEDEFDGDFDGG